MYYPYRCNRNPLCPVSLMVEEEASLKYIHIESGLLFLVATLVYLNKIQHVTHHSIANARAVLPASSK